MVKHADSDDVLTEGIYQGEIQPNVVNRARTDFMPWHKPRKHYVRLEQWCREIRALLKAKQTLPDEEFRYLGLPADDMLDIRVLHGVCTRANVKLHYLGFNSSLNSPMLNLSQNEINSEKFIHHSSVIVGDRLENVALLDSMAYRYVHQHSPYDVINLDLCGSVTNLAANGNIPYLEAIRALCDIQIQRRGGAWLLFLTTRVIRECLDSGTRKRLFDQLLKNILTSSGFSEALNRRLGIDEGSIRAELAPDGALDDDTWFRAYVLSVSKWLLSYMMGGSPKITVRMLPSYVYSVQSGKPDMASLAFLIEPENSCREDTTGLTIPRSQNGILVDEPECAEQIVHAISEIVDLDKKLNSDKQLKLKMFTKSSTLLASLGYDMNAYKSFSLAD